MRNIDENSFRQKWIKLKEEWIISYWYENFMILLKKYWSVEKVLENNGRVGWRKRKYDIQQIIDYRKLYWPTKAAKLLGCSEWLVYQVIKKAKKDNIY